MDAIAPQVRAGQLIILESTTYPGTTEEVLRPGARRRTGLQVGRDIFLAFSPERVDPGTKLYQTKNTPKVVGGTTPWCTQGGGAPLRPGDRARPSRSRSTQSAEMIKLLENTFRAVNIGARQRDRADVREAGARRLGGHRRGGDQAVRLHARSIPGPGIGGHCIPLDPHYLAVEAADAQLLARFIELASEINGHMPEVVVRRATAMLNDAKKERARARRSSCSASPTRRIRATRASPRRWTSSGCSRTRARPRLVPRPVFERRSAARTAAIEKGSALTPQNLKAARPAS